MFAYMTWEGCVTIAFANAECHDKLTAFWCTAQERPVTKEVVTYVQENHPVAKQVCTYLQAVLAMLHKAVHLNLSWSE
jgi:L-asparaginase II